MGITAMVDAPNGTKAVVDMGAEALQQLLL